MKEDMKSVIADTFSEMLEKEDIDKITVTRLIATPLMRLNSRTYHHSCEKVSAAPAPMNSGKFM